MSLPEVTKMEPMGDLLFFGERPLLRSEHNGRFPMRKRMDRGTLSYWGFYASKGGRTRSGRWSR